MNVILELLTSTLVFLVISYFVFYKSWLKAMGNKIAKLSTIQDLTRIEQSVKEDFNNKLELLRADLSKDNISHQIEYSYLYQKRAEATVELYQKLQELHSAMSEWTAKVKLIYEDGEKENQIKLKNANDAITSFRNFYYKHKLFFDKDFCSEIESIFHEYWDKGWEYAYKIGRIKSGQLNSEIYDSFSKELSIISDEFQNQIPKRLEKIEDRCRIVLNPSESNYT
jgi:hypothetical protein